MAENTSSNEAVGDQGEETTRKLTKAEKKALYKPTYEEPHGTRRKVLKEVFLNEKDEASKEELIQSILYSIYENDENPYVSMLQLHKICPDYASVKPKSLASLTVAHLRSWLWKLDDPLTLFESCVTKDLQMDAFRIATAKHTGNLKLFKEIFQLDDPLLLPLIKDEIQSMIDRHMFKEAMDVVDEFQLHREYSLNSFIIPCLLQDKLSLVVKFMEPHKDIQEEFLSYLDEFVGLTEDEVARYLRHYKENNVMTLPYERFTGKTIEKLVSKLATDFMLPIESAAPKLFRSRKEGELRYKVQSRFVDKDLSDDAYFGHISEVLRNGEESLKMYFIKFLTNGGYYQDAVRWAVYCNISNANLPYKLQRHLMNNPKAASEAELDIRRMERRAEDVGDDGHELFPGYCIVIVDNRNKLKKLLSGLEKDEFIGIDSEWKAQYLGPTESVALLQIAVIDAVYLVDFCAMEEKLSEEDWSNLLRTLLCGKARKLGFDLGNDLRALFNGAPLSVRSASNDLCNVVCLKRLVENFLEIDSSILENPNFSSASSENDADETAPVLHFKLSDLSERLLNVKLDKSEQCSNWSIRPLRAKQKRYAAMDAYIVVELYAKLREMAESREIDFEKLVELSMITVKKKDKAKTKKDRIKVDVLTWKEIYEKLSDLQSGTRLATELRCIVDTMLLGLGKHLRRCGVNVLIPVDRSELKSIAIGNERVIVTSGKAYEELRRLFAERVLTIPNASNLSAIEQLRYVFSRCKVTFEGLDNFSRCMECNGTCFVKVPGPVIQALYESNVICKNEFHDEPFDFEGWIQRLDSLDHQDFSGIGCCVLPPEEDYMAVQCHGGIVNITSNTVQHDFLDECVDILIKKVPEQVSSRPGYIFYICGHCGKIYWEER